MNQYYMAELQALQSESGNKENKGFYKQQTILTGWKSIAGCITITKWTSSLKYAEFIKHDIIDRASTRRKSKRRENDADLKRKHGKLATFL